LNSSELKTVMDTCCLPTGPSTEALHVCIMCGIYSIYSICTNRVVITPTHMGVDKFNRPVPNAIR